MTHSEKIDKVAAALVEFQSKMPHIEKDREVKGRNYKFRYASLETIANAIRPALKECSLTYMQFIEGATLETMVLHASGQFFLSSLDMQGFRTPSEQGYGKTVTYMKRYALCASLGITTDQDDDGQGAESAPLSVDKPRQAQTSRRQAVDNGRDEIGELFDSQPEADERAAKARAKTIHTKLTNMGFEPKDRKLALAVVGEIIRREITTTKQVKGDEMQHLMQTLNDLGEVPKDALMTAIHKTVN